MIPCNNPALAASYIFSRALFVNARRSKRRVALWPADTAEMAETDEFAALFVPETERERLEAGEQGDGWHGLKQGLGLVASLQIVIGDAGAQVMDVMETDVA